VYGNYYLRVNKYFSESKEIVNVRFLKKYTNFSNSLKLHFHSIKEYKDAASDHTYICN
jgi:hypothetical protein